MKANSEPEIGLYFWRHSDANGAFTLLSTWVTELTPNFCVVHSFAFDCSTCPACEPVGRRGEQLSLFGGAHGTT